MARGRNKRVPFNGMRLKLEVDEATKRRLEAEGKVAVWMTDKGGKLQSAQASDYEFVTEKKGQEDSPRSLRVGTNKDGSAQIGYLMEIPKEYYEEDQAAIEEKNAAIDSAIKGELTGPAGVDPNLGSASIAKVDYKP